MTGQLSSARLNTYIGHKRQLLGNHAGRPAPAWKTNTIPTMMMNGHTHHTAVSGTTTTASHGNFKGKHQQGSKIFLSKLPLDVDEKEVEELFRKTIGPLRECFLVYNNQGRSKGMAVVGFARAGDAAVARAKYDGKIVDGRRPLKIEIIVDDNFPALNSAPQPASLLTRLGSPVVNSNPTVFPPLAAQATPVTAARTALPNTTNTTPQPPVNGTINGTGPVPTRKRRIKKGPKRIHKRMTVTREQLDKDMEDYRAAADILFA